MVARNVLILLVSLAAAFSRAAGPATRPTSRPATRPSSAATTAPARVRDGLLNGSVRFLAPAQWKLFDRKEDGTQVWYHAIPDQATVSLRVTPEPKGIAADDVAARQQMTRAFLGLITRDLASRNVQIVSKPRVEADARFLLRIHERYRD